MADLSSAAFDSLRSGVDAVLAAYDSSLKARVFAETLPIIGSNIVAGSGTDGALTSVAGLRAALADAFTSLAAATDITAAQVENAIDSALADAGLDGGLVAVNIDELGNVTLTLSQSYFQTFDMQVAPSLGLDSLGLNLSGIAQVAADFGIDLTFGVNSGGFYVDTSGQDELTLGLTVGGVDLATSGALGPVAPWDRSTTVLQTTEARLPAPST